MTFRFDPAFPIGACALFLGLALGACGNASSNTPYQGCVPGTQTCAGNSIITCAADGATYHAPVQCPGSCTLTATGPVCDAAGQGGGANGGSNGSGGNTSGGSASGGDAGDGNASGGSDSSGGSDGSGGSSAGSGGGGGTPGNAPVVIFLVDTSSSAAASISSGGNRWDAIEASFTASSHPLEAYQGQVAFGARRYFSSMEACPETTALAPALDNYAAVASFIAEFDFTSDPPPKTDTPTGAALALTAGSLASHSGPKYVVLITDGIPDTCSNLDGICIDDAVYAAQQARAQGITTILVAIGDAFSNYTFNQDFANAGAGQPVAEPQPGSQVCSSTTPTYSETGGNAAFYAIADDAIATSLASTLAQIVGNIAGN